MKPLLWKYPGKLIGVIALRMAATVAGTAFTLMLAELLNSAVQGSVRRLLLTGGTVIVLMLLAQVFEYVTSIQKKRLLREWNVLLKSILFSRLLEKSMGNFEERNSASYSNGLLTDCESLEQLYFSNSLELLDEVAELVITSIAVIWISPVLFLAMIFLTFLTLLLMNVGIEKFQSGMEKYTNAREAYSVFLKENLSCFRLIRMFQMKEKVRKAHDDACQQMEEKKCRQQILMAQKSCVMSLTGLGSTVLIMMAAAYLALKGAVSVGFVLAAGQLIGKITYPVTVLPGIIMNYKSAKPIEERLSIYDAGKIREGKKEKTDNIQKLVVENVSFSYPNGSRNSLDGVSAYFDAGKKYLLVGESGSGKTTLLQLLTDCFDSYAGNVLIDGTELRSFSEESICRKIGVMTQEVFLFQDTLRQNLALYGDYSDEEIKDALKRAGLDGDGKLFPDGLDTMIEENGRNFSGGERQRIALARVLLHGFSWLFFDEFTSNLDVHNALLVEEQLLRLEGITLLTVSHHLNDRIARMYDEILVLDSGKIVEKGTFEELMERQGEFSKMMSAGKASL